MVGNHTAPEEQDSPGARGVALLETMVRDALGERVRRAGGPLRAGTPRRAGLRVVLGTALVAGAMVLALLWVRRPVPVEAQLPMAQRSGTGSGTASSEAPAAGRPSGGPGAGPGGPTTAGPLVVHVAGAVLRPGLVTLASGGRVADAVAAAGGLRPDADPDRLNLAAPLRDGERVAVPVLGAPMPPAPVGSGAGAGAGAAVDGAPSPPVDLNTADAAALEELPGVGPATAAAIVAHREASGPFGSVDDLLDVRGIGDAKLEALRDAVTVGP